MREFAAQEQEGELQLQQLLELEPAASFRPVRRSIGGVPGAHGFDQGHQAVAGADAFRECFLELVGQGQRRRHQLGHLLVGHVGAEVVLGHQAAHAALGFRTCQLVIGIDHLRVLRAAFHGAGEHDALARQLALQPGLVEPEHAQHAAVVVLHAGVQIPPPVA